MGRPISDAREQETLVALSDDERRLIAVLQTHAQGLTVRQLEARLKWSQGGVQLALDILQERQLVARLNTVIPSYIYRYEGLDLNAE
jgi:hypothetical protein